MSDANTMALCARVVYQRKSSVVVVSATSGTTNLLLELGQKSAHGDNLSAAALLDKISTRHLTIARELNLSDERHQQLHTLLEELRELSQGIRLLKDASDRNLDSLVSLGERLSSVLFSEALEKEFKKQNSHLKVEFCDARLIRSESVV